MSKQRLVGSLHSALQRAGRLRRYGLVMVLSLALSLGIVGTAVAAQSSSTNYSVTETQFGIGSSLHDCSTNYCAKTSAGDTTVGSMSSTNYSAETGANTTDIPLLEVTVDGGNQDLGVLDSDHTGTVNAGIKVRSYLSSGYSMYITGEPLSQGTHKLKALSLADSCPCTSHPGAEQFGINMVANNTPAIGADPVQVPSSSFSFGTVADDYITPDLFLYDQNEPVASSATSSGETDYTLSMIVNVSNVTPGGRYSGVYSAVVVPVY